MIILQKESIFKAAKTPHQRFVKHFWLIFFADWYPKKLFKHTKMSIFTKKVGVSGEEKYQSKKSNILRAQAHTNKQMLSLNSAEHLTWRENITFFFVLFVSFTNAM